MTQKIQKETRVDKLEEDKNGLHTVIFKEL